MSVTVASNHVIAEATFNDDALAAYLAANDMLDALLDFQEFKWVLTAQIRRRREMNDFIPERHWERAITSLVIRTNSRILELKRALRAAGRGDEMYAALADLREDRMEDES